MNSVPILGVGGTCSLPCQGCGGMNAVPILGVAWDLFLALPRLWINELGSNPWGVVGLVPCLVKAVEE